jgi:hypothetical protein
VFQNESRPGGGGVRESIANTQKIIDECFKQLKQ